MAMRIEMSDRRFVYHFWPWRKIICVSVRQEHIKEINFGVRAAMLRRAPVGPARSRLHLRPSVACCHLEGGIPWHGQSASCIESEQRSRKPWA